MRAWNLASIGQRARSLLHASLATLVEIKYCCAVGAVKQTDNPSAEEVDRVHAAVVAAIRSLFDQHKHLIPGWQHKVLQIY